MLCQYTTIIDQNICVNQNLLSFFCTLSDDIHFTDLLYHPLLLLLLLLYYTYFCLFLVPF